MRILVYLVLLLLTLPIAHAQDNPIESVACDEGGELTMWVWSLNWQPILQASIDDWVEDFCPDASVELVQIPFGEYWDALREAAANDELPDMFHMNHVFFTEFEDQILNFQPYYDAAEVDTNIWRDGMVDRYRVDGDLYAAPVTVDSVAIYYNKDLFDDANLTYPFRGWDWNTFAGYAAILTNPAEDVYGAAVFSSYQAGYTNWIAAAGARPLVNTERTRCTLADAQSIDALSFLRELYDAGFMPSIETLEAVELPPELPQNSNLSENATALFLEGKLAMLSQGSWRLPVVLNSVDFEWDVVTLPRYPESGRTVSLLHSVGTVVSETSANPDLAADLMLYLASDDTQIRFARAGGAAPSSPSSRLFDVWVGSFGARDVNADAFVTSLVDSQGFTVFDEIWTFANVEFERLFLDPELTIEEAVQEGCAYINPFLFERS